MNNNFILLTGFSLLIVHEMDAVRRHEWRMFYGLSKLNDEQAFNIFSLLHVPLLVTVLWGLFAATEMIRDSFILGLDLFFIIHFFFHIAFLKNKNNEFKSFFSWLVITGVFIFGLLHFLIKN